MLVLAAFGMLVGCTPRAPVVPPFRGLTDCPVDLTPYEPVYVFIPGASEAVRLQFVEEQPYLKPFVDGGPRRVHGYSQSGREFTFDLVEDETGDMKCEVSPADGTGPWVSGVVRDALGRPVQGATVTACTALTVTDASGQYRVKATSDDCTVIISCSHESSAGSAQGPIPSDQVFDATLNPSLIVHAGQEVHNQLPLSPALRRTTAQSDPVRQADREWDQRGGPTGKGFDICAIRAP